MLGAARFFGSVVPGARPVHVQLLQHAGGWHVRLVHGRAHAAPSQLGASVLRARTCSRAALLHAWPCAMPAPQCKMPNGYKACDGRAWLREIMEELTIEETALAKYAPDFYDLQQRLMAKRDWVEAHVITNASQLTP